MGLIVWVLKRDGEQEMRTLVQVMGERMPGPFEPTPERPAVMVDFDRGGTRPAAFDAERKPGMTPALAQAAMPKFVLYNRQRVEGKVGPMTDGRFVWTSDERFPSDGPLPYWDRWETPDQYEALSR